MKTAILNLLELLRSLSPDNAGSNQTYAGMRLIPIPVEKNNNHNQPSR
jgi:hypothetical protein